MDFEKEQNNGALDSFGQQDGVNMDEKPIDSTVDNVIEGDSGEVTANNTVEEEVTKMDSSDAAEEKTAEVGTSDVVEEKTAEASVGDVTEEKATEISADSLAEQNTISAPEAGVINTSNGETKKKGHGRVLALAAVLILIMVGCVGAYFALLPKPSDKKEDKKTEEKKEEVSSYRLSGNDLSDFDLRFLQIEGKEDNLIYSPLSIKYALAMLKDGADGETKKQIEDLIGDYKAKKYINSKNISLANAMFIRDEYKEQVLDSYITGLKTNYNADVLYDSFTAPTAINNWISDKTLGLINNALGQDDLGGLNYALINALAIDQNWNYTLQCQPHSSVPCKTQPDGSTIYDIKYDHENYNQYIPFVIDEDTFPAMKFNNLDNRKSVKIGASFNKYDIIKDKGEDAIRTKVTEEYKKWLTTEDGKWVLDNYKEDPKYYTIDPSDVKANVEQYIKELKNNYGRENSSTDFYFNDASDAKVFAKDLKEYDGNTLQYVGIMPKNTDLKTFVSDFTAGKGSEYIKGLKELKKENFKDGVVTRIDANIPLFKYDYNLALKDDLVAMGVKDVFESGKADLSSLSKEGSYIGVVKHKANIEFSNEGIKAGAATVMGGLGGGGIGFEYLWDVPVEKIDLTFDKPFVYLIRDKNSGEVWFVGTVYEPLEKVKK